MASARVTTRTGVWLLGHRRQWPVHQPALGAPAVAGAGRGVRRAGPEVELLDGCLADAVSIDATVAPTILLIAGAADLGKTALVAYCAHRAAHRFPDGQLYVDLRGQERNRTRTREAVLAGLLRALGVTGAPADLDERAALYRSALAGKRLLVVLDDAQSASQVRPLLPGSRSCVTLVTSRDDLASLVAREGARRLILRPMSEPEAEQVLRVSLEPARIRLDAASRRKVVAECRGSPLAIRSKAERILRHQASPSS